MNTRRKLQLALIAKIKKTTIRCVVVILFLRTKYVRIVLRVNRTLVATFYYVNFALCKLSTCTNNVQRKRRIKTNARFANSIICSIVCKLYYFAMKNIDFIQRLQ